LLLNLISFFSTSLKHAGTCLALTGMLLLAFTPMTAQDADTIASRSAVQKHSPQRALLFSALIPGLGQVYNQKYWKVPIIYGAGATFAYYVGFNQLKYKKFRDAYVNGTDGTKTLIDGHLYEYNSLPRGRDYYRRYRDLSVLGMGFIYFLNIVDAMIDAEFFNYDVSDDLTLHVQPTIFNNPDLTSSVGFRIDIVF
jgi:hypothetical protein